MATSPDTFSPQEWDLLMRAPAAAIRAVVTADPRAGSERVAVSKDWLEAASANAAALGLYPDVPLIELLVGEPLGGEQSPSETVARGVADCRAVRELLERRAKPEETDAYCRFVLTLATRAGSATGDAPDEPAVLRALTSALAVPDEPLTTGGRKPRKSGR